MDNDKNKEPRIIPVYIEDEMKKSYLEYSMSVIVSRALPDVRDGLKPVHRRILYAMHELNLYHNKAYKKSARVVGDTMGRYHPHGDAALYGTIVRMTQDFSMRYPLVDGQGNFGSIDGDSAAAMRYTEVRLSKIAEEMLNDLDKNTVDFVPNFDDSLKEPKVLPSAIPNLLLNGASGIAVGMATNIPPHNLREIINALIALIKNPDITIDEIMHYLKGPDFPTGGIIMGLSGIKSAFHTGRGRIKVRGKVFFENKKNGKKAIIIEEIPYAVNKSNLIDQIVKLVNNKVVEGISDIRDESDRDGMRIVIELRKNAFENVVLNKLYKHTSLQTTFGVINLALVDNEPKVLNIKELLEHFLNHRHDVLIRKLKFDLKNAEKKAHILAGLLIALNNLDAIIKLIRASKNPDEAKKEMIFKFSLSSEQAKAILEMRLQRLTALEREKIEKEYEDTVNLIKKIKEILSSEALQYKMIADELLALKKEYGDDRRTEILLSEEKDISIEDLIIKKEEAMTITHKGYINRVPIDTYRQQRRGGKGMRGMALKDDDFLESVFTITSHDHILFISDKGIAYGIMAYELPDMGRTSRGKPIVNFLKFDADEHLRSIIKVNDFDDDLYIVMASAQGLIKKVDLKKFANVKHSGVRVMGLREGDHLVSASLISDNKEIMVFTRNGWANRFDGDSIRSSGRAAMGVRGIRLREDDKVVDMLVVSREEDNCKLLIVTENGYGKRTPIKEFRKTSRGGKGVISLKPNEKTGLIVAAKPVFDDDEVVFTSSDGLLIRVQVSDISEYSRTARGVKIITLKDGQKVVDMAIIKGIE